MRQHFLASIVVLRESIVKALPWSHFDEQAEVAEQPVRIDIIDYLYVALLLQFSEFVGL